MQPQNLFTFDHVPALRELLPDTGGLPGYTYAQVSVLRRRHMQDAGWEVEPGTVVYTITTEFGSVDCELWRRGKPIPGQSPQAGARKCLIDEAIVGALSAPKGGPPPKARSPIAAPQPSDFEA